MVCELLKNREMLAVDADWEGYSHWVDRAKGTVVSDPPYPVPAGWLDRFAWRISRAEAEALAAHVPASTAFLCGSAENEANVRDLFDLVVCLVVDDETLRDRLLTRTSNAFGKHPRGTGGGSRQQHRRRVGLRTTRRDDHRCHPASSSGR